LDTHASPSLKQRYLPPIYAGRWSATMCLTEAHAGTDLGLIRTRAEPQGDGSYVITGNKIFITGGEHDLTENIIHLVLARLPDAPPGPKGISLFLVPKFLPCENGDLGERNQVSCGSIEHKMGIKASATCVINFDGAYGWLVGAANNGLAAMFTMMNYERVTIGLQGVGCAETSYQNAVAYARERLQSRAPGGAQYPERPADPLLVHPDVRRMLLTARALTEGGRALASYIGQLLDISAYSDEKTERTAAAERVALLTPLAKAFLTDTGLESTLLGQQVLGGHGYIRESGQEQLVRDARIAQIYEGTNGIQALDLLSRKIVANGGTLLSAFIEEMRTFANQPETPHQEALLMAVERLSDTSAWLIDRAAQNPQEIGAASVEYLHLFGYVACAYMWARMAAVAQQRRDNDPLFYEAKLATAGFYFSRLLPRINTLEVCLRAGSASLYEMSDAQF
ncbi:acyl-CoA dehydrogenase, partial [Pseudomonas sp. CrR25]|nr:acyl-CoA dehydrogenase [Pseudomonas sp. CrR25]